MKIIGYDLAATIIAESSDDLAKVILPCLDTSLPSNVDYHYTLHDDGDHLYVKIRDDVNTTLWYEDVGSKSYVLHFSQDRYKEESKKLFMKLAESLDRAGFDFELEKTPIYENGQAGDTEFILSKTKYRN